jgi:hypothetical protein
MFNNIPCTELENHFDKTIYRYQIFQVTDIIIKSSDAKQYECDNPMFNILESGGRQLSMMECGYCTFFLYEIDAKKKQALDLHKMLQGSFKSKFHREQSMQDYFRRFIDERDLDFFISSVTNHQLHEEEYYHLLSLIAEEYPELLI